jgi:hypothetical protein
MYVLCVRHASTYCAEYEILLAVFMNGHGPMYSGIHSETLFLSL